MGAGRAGRASGPASSPPALAVNSSPLLSCYCLRWELLWGGEGQVNCRNLEERSRGRTRWEKMGGGGRWGWRPGESRRGFLCPLLVPWPDKAESTCVRPSLRTHLPVHLMWLSSPDRQQVRMSLVTSLVAGTHGALVHCVGHGRPGPCRLPPSALGAW